jgi:hypothetical protein
MRQPFAASPAWQENAMSRCIKLQLEILEEREVPSGTAVVPTGGSAAAATIGPLPPVYHSTHALAGNGHGSFSVNVLVVDAGLTYKINGQGHFAHLGDVNIAGSVQGTGMIASGQAHGMLTFSNSHGSVTVDVTGPVQSAFGAMPTWYHYIVTSATGDFKSVKDSGTLRIDFHLNPTMDPLKTGVIAGHETGTFRIAI